LQSLQSADPTFITAQGTAIPVAIDLAEKSFDEQPGGGRALILISDGEDHDPGAVDRAADAFAEGTVVYTVGVGSPEGAPVPAADGQYKRDESGNVVRTRLEEQALREIALAGGGRAYHVNQDETAIRALRREVGQLQKRDIAIRSFSERESWYAWFVLPALLLLLLRLYLEQRPAAGRAHAGGRMWKGGAAGLLLLFALPGLSAQSAHRSLLSGDQDYRDERYGEAEKHYRNATQADPKNLAAQYNYGNALYKQGKYPEAAEQFGHVAAADPQPGVLHNLGNALLQQRKYREAAQAYERSLRMRPGHPETKMNLQMAKKKLQEEEEKQRQQQNQQSQQNQNQQNQQNQNQQNQQQQQQQNQKQQQQPQQPQHQPSAPDSPTPQPDNPSGKMNREQARRLLETTVGPNDPKSAQRYRQRQMPPSGSKAKKDW
ncbi:MAG TPA: tetratricopeptide repeat protein, partial [Saprospiraceae bacterium]|nr:tetratricopeptide repeat protein [Saprospiraceae bacterium]